MSSQKTSLLDSVLEKVPLTLSLEIPLPAPHASDSCSSTPSFSLGPVHLPLEISTTLPNISPPSRSDLVEIGSSGSLDTIGDQVP